MADELIDFVAKREQAIEKKRRTFERVMFQNILGCYSVIDQGGSIFKVELVDISGNGCMFQVPWTRDSQTRFSNGAELPLRFYFTNESFIPAIVNIKYSTEYVNESGDTFIRYGCEFDTSQKTFEAVAAFIEFIQKFAEYSTMDKSQHKVYMY